MKVVKILMSLLAVLALVAIPAIAEAQQPGKMPLIGYLSARPGPDEAFEQGLRDLGWMKGQNIAIEYRWARGEAVPALVKELVRLKVDIIVTRSRSKAQAAKNATTTIPIVMATGSEAVQNGLVASLARPGGNVTGMSEQYSELHTILLELLHEILPNVTRVGFLWSRHSPTLVRTYERLQARASALGLTIQSFDRYKKELESVLAAAAQERIGALIVPAGMYSRFRQQIAEFAVKNRVPVFSLSSSSVEKAFGLLAYAPDWSYLLRRAAW